MHTGKGSITELTLEDGCLYARIACPENLVPVPGQYLLASDDSDSPLPVPIFYTDFTPGGFITTADASYWKPGDELHLRGPLGRGFSVPVSARKIVLIAFDDAPSRLRGLIRPALAENVSVVLVSNSVGDGLPDDVEVQPLSAMNEVMRWADYAALDVSRENLPQLREQLLEKNQLAAVKARTELGRSETQILVRTAMPCGGIAECGVCAVTTTSTWKLACKDGPVFDLRELI
jgi:dihydroorotate dehydrogenase electron transfer subunit